MTDLHGRNEAERKALRAKIDELNRIAFERWDDPVWRREMAQELTETIYEGFQHENLLALLADVENAPFDGRVFVKEVRGLRAFWVARGGYVQASRMRSDIAEIERDSVGFHVEEFVDKLRTNFAETQADLVDLGIQRMDAEVNQHVLRLFQAALPLGGPFTTSTNGFSLAALNAGVREVRDETREFGVSIVGRSTMTDQIIDALMDKPNGSGYLPETNDAMIRRGVLGSYRGARIVTLKNYKDDRDRPFFPANELYVVGRDAAKFAFWGGLASKEYEELDNWYWHFVAKRDFGGMVHHAERVRRLVDNSIAA